MRVVLNANESLQRQLECLIYKPISIQWQSPGDSESLVVGRSRQGRIYLSTPRRPHFPTSCLHGWGTLEIQHPRTVDRSE